MIKSVQESVSVFITVVGGNFKAPIFIFTTMTNTRYELGVKVAFPQFTVKTLRRRMDEDISSSASGVNE